MIHLLSKSLHGFLARAGVPLLEGKQCRTAPGEAVPHCGFVTAAIRCGTAAMFAAIVVLRLLGPHNASGSDWPTYRHDNARSGWTPEKLSLPLESRWVYAAPAPPRQAWAGEEGRTIDNHLLVQRVKFDDVLHVAVAGDRVYFGSSVDHRVYCLRAGSGEVVWSFCTGGPVRLTPTLWNQRVFFGSDDGCAYCLDAASGRLIWKVAVSPVDEWLLARGEMISRWPVRTGVLVEDGVAYFGAGIFPHDNIYFCAADARTGEVLWRRDGISEANAGRNDLSPQGHLLAAGELLFVPSGGTLPAIVDRRTGQVLEKPTAAWRTTAGGVVGGSEALLADDQIYSFGAQHILALDQRTGKVGFGWFVGQQMAVVDDAAYVTTGETILRLDRKAYAEASRPRHELQLEISAVAKKAGEEEAARLAALRSKVAKLKDAGVVWKAASTAGAALIGAGDLVIAGGDDKVTAFDAATGKEAWHAAVDGRARGLAVAGGCLWVSTSQGKIHCFVGSTAPQAGAAPPVAAAAEPYPRDEQTAVYQSAAEEILRRSGVQRGFCLVLGGRQGRLGYELAKRSALKIYTVDEDPQQVEAARRALAAAGLYGTRVTAHCFPLAQIPYSNYFADLIVCDGLLLGGRLPDVADKVARHLKPCGGVVCLGLPARTAAGDDRSVELCSSWLRAMQLGQQGSIRIDASWATLTRGPLPGAGTWTHQYAEPGNSACSDDQRVRGDLGVLWYGDPGPGEMVNRHASAVAPLALGGRFFIQGERKILAYDAYNGVFLWEKEDPGARRTGVKSGDNPGNLAAGDERIFVVADNACEELDAASGRTLAVHRLPPSIDADTRQWQYLAYRNGLLFGSAGTRASLVEQLKRHGETAEAAKDVIFAIDTRSGRHLWAVTGRSIAPATVALGPDRVFFVDSSITVQQREALLRQDKSELRKLSGEEARRAEARLKNIDARLAVALDAQTGKELWSRPVDVTDCSKVGTGGGKLTLMYANDTLILCGANANGHYWPQFLAGEFSRRRLVALSATDGRVLWAKDANYRHRPIIVGERVIAEPWAFDLRTGQQQMRPNLLTGQPVPWCMMRTGHHCGALAACPHLIAFRSGSTGYYDLDADVGVQHFAGQRPGCWINAVPANGLLVIPEASAGCVCLFSIESTIVMEPRAPRRPWAIAGCAGPNTPVRHLAINLGAPGDRRDSQGNVWLAYPRPGPYKQTGLEVAIDLKPTFLPGGGYTSLDSENTAVPGGEIPWLFTSWARGLTKCSVPLLGKSDPPARYDVRLYFADLSDTPAAGRVFDVKLQGKTVIEGLDIAAAAGGQKKALVREIRSVDVSDNLLVELTPRTEKPSPQQMPILNAIEAIRSD
jgi:outer membrane protein assembly factor BamB